MPQPHEMSAQELLQAYRSKTLSPVEATRAVLDHIERAIAGLCALHILVSDVRRNRG